jgi:hypothetical protein
VLYPRVSFQRTTLPSPTAEFNRVHGVVLLFFNEYFTLLYSNSCLLFYSNYPLYVSVARPSSGENMYIGNQHDWLEDGSTTETCSG